MLRGASDTAIARLAVRADPADALAARLCAERMLGAIELRPAGLPPAAILCVRELRDPRPGTLPLASRQLGPPPVWAHAVRREVDRLARAAVRPADGAVRATAEAVVFADHSELLACLGSDLVAGLVGARWWWRILVGGVDSPRRAAVAAWLRAPEHAPAALHALAVRGEAARFVQRFDDREADALVAAFGQAFGLPAPGGGAAPAPAPSAPRRAPVAPAAAVAEDARTPLSPIAAPWFAVAPEADGVGLSIPQRVLLGIALALVRAPILPRSAGFAIDLAAWRAAAMSAAQRSSSAADRPAPSGARIASIMAPPVVVPVGAGASALPARASRAPLAAAELAVDEPTSPGRPAAMRAAVEAASEVSAAVPSAAATLASADAPTSPQSAPRSAEALATEPQALEPPPSAEPPRGSPAAPRTQSVGPRRGRAFGPPIHTRLGGVFYLVNLALYLQLYGDGENLPLPLWDFVALIARALLTGDSRIADTLAGVGFADDPVWELLAEFAGHAADESPGAGFVAPAAWRLPRAWLTPFTPGPVQHRIDRDRLTIWHAEGFAIIDVPAETDPAAQLAGELAAYVGAIGPAHAAPAAPSLEIAPVSPADPAQDWVARLVPYVRARLRRALGIEDDEIVARLLVHTARVHATATHVDVVLPLDALPIEVRFAGLDRDPGWVPAAGRFIAFHFE